MRLIGSNLLRSGGLILPSHTRRGARYVLPLDLVFVLVLSIISFNIGFQFIRAVGATGSLGGAGFAPSVLRPALAFGCGYSFANPLPSGAIDLFESGPQKNVAAFDCSTLSFKSDSGAPLSIFQQSQEFLLRATGVFLRIFGVEWTAIYALAATLYSAAVLFAYLGFRTLAPPALAFAAALFFAFSIGHLTNIGSLRDYGKAPFVVLSLAIGLLLVLHVRRAWLAVLLSALAAVVVYMGARFRVDVISVTPVLLLAILLAPLSRSVDRGSDRTLSDRGARLGQALSRASIAFTKILCCALILGSVALLQARPQGVGDGGLYGNLIYGRFQPMLEALGLASSRYTVGTLYNDSYAHALFWSYADRSYGKAPNAPHREDGLYRGGPDFNENYVEVSRTFYLDIFKTFPADALISGVAATFKILQLPFDRTQESITSLSSYRSLITLASDIKSGIESKLRWWVISIFALMLTFLIKPRAGLFLAGVCGWAGLVGSGQWNVRHVFHLEVVFWIMLLALIASAGHAASSARRGFLPSIGHQPKWGRLSVPARRFMVLFALSCLAVAAIFGTRLYQHFHLVTAFTQLARAPRAPLELVANSAAGMEAEGAEISVKDLWFPALTGAAGPTSSIDMQHRYLAVSLDPALPGCSVRHMYVGFGYKSKRGFEDFSQSYAIDLNDAGQSTLFVPAFSDLHRIFVTSKACLHGVESLVGRLPTLPFTLVLTPGWETHRLHASLMGSEDASQRLQYVDFNVGSCSRFVNFWDAARPSLDMSADEDTIRYVSSLMRRSEYKVISREVELSEGDCVYLFGQVGASTVYLGLMGATGWAGGRYLPARGSYAWLQRIEKSGLYSLGVGFNEDHGNIEIDFTKARQRR